MTRWQGSAPPPLAQIERTMTQVCLKLKSCIRADNKADIDSKHQVAMVQPTTAPPILREVAF
jgi:hypothetical protein